MIRKPATISFWNGRLPHWEVEEGRYFVTLPLAGAIPRAGYDRIHTIAAELDRIPREADGVLKVQRRIFKEMEAWLDRAEWATSLHQPPVAQVVMEAIAHRQTKRIWKVFEFVVMPSHLHLFFEILQEGMKWVLEEFKRWTGHQAGKLLDMEGGPFWQREWFDHWSRSDEEDERIITYVRQNPVTAGLVKNYAEWPYGSWSR